jgi:glyoxylase-like metal-dependent hydrolase (beta-lactamase superfamily II)
LPSNGSVPGLPDWIYIETPGHSPGHISLFRERDRVLIAGDAFVTTKAESAFYALTSKEELSGPPKYFTCDWASARFSLYRIVELNPEIVATGHGKPMSGAAMRGELESLAIHFDDLATPGKGRYVSEPAITDESGVVSWPPKTERIPKLVRIALLSVLAVTVGIIAVNYFRRDKYQMAEA